MKAINSGKFGHDVVRTEVRAANSRNALFGIMHLRERAITKRPSDTPAQVSGCAICGRPVAARYRPFCSARCRDIDLHRWLSGSYAIPAEDAEEARDEPDMESGAGPEAKSGSGPDL